MDIDRLRSLLEAVANAEISVQDALEALRSLPYENLEDYARLDLHRPLRTGIPEVVFCENKSTTQVIQILRRLWEHHERVLATRVTPAMAGAIQIELPEAAYDPVSRLLTLARAQFPAALEADPYILVLSAGTADQSVAEEAARTAEFFGSRVIRRYDVGVAGLHRLLDQREWLYGAEVIISVAGMEGALTSVVAGLVACPVIGVPTSVGYGASFGGLAALLAMLNSCAPGVAVVNIDNGFGAGQFAHLLLQRIRSAQKAVNPV